jgi:hypothetical protein
VSAADTASSRAALPFGLSLPAALWYACMANILLGVGVSLVRVLGPDWMWAGHFSKIADPLILLMAFAALLSIGRLKLDALSLFAAGLVVFGVLVGIVQRGSARAFVAHLFMGLFAFGLYTAARNARWDRAWLERFLSVSSAAILAVYTVTVLAYWSIVVFTDSPLYLGVLTGDLLLPLAWYLVRRRWLAAGLCAALVLAAGNRGAYVAMFVMAFVALPLPLPRRLSLRVAAGVFAAGIFVTAIFLAEPTIRRFHLPGSLQYLETKWFQMNPFSPDFDADVASAGRATEIEGSYDAFRVQPWNWLTGRGYGWTYVKTLLPGEDDLGTPIRHYVHLSPMNYLLTHGLPAAILFLGLIWWEAARGFRWAALRAGLHSAPYALALYLVGALVWGLTVFSFGVNPMIWVTLGTLASLAREPVNGPG